MRKTIDRLKLLSEFNALVIFTFKNPRPASKEESAIMTNYLRKGWKKISFIEEVKNEKKI
jgi:hypothetical protein